MEYNGKLAVLSDINHNCDQGQFLGRTGMSA